MPPPSPHLTSILLSAMMNLLILLSSFSFSLGYRCSYEWDLDALSTEFQIRSASWIEDSTNVFLFGSLAEGADAKIHMGFYSGEEMIYKAIVDCGGSTWKIMYDGGRNHKSGDLNGGCPVGQFDLIARVGCPEWLGETEKARLDIECSKQVYFVFNGQVLATEYWVVNRESRMTKDVPVSLSGANTVKAKIKRTGASFTREAYGKCFAFPPSYSDNCAGAGKWMEGRDNRESDKADLGTLGFWSQDNTVECEDAAPVYYKAVQRKIVPDALADGETTCCCGYMNGYVDSSSCKLGREACSLESGEIEEECNSFI